VNAAASSLRDIAVVRLSALGDVTLLLPVIETLKAAAPAARIVWVIGSAAHELVQGVTGVEFVVFDKRRGLRAYSDLRRRLRGRRFDVLLAMQASWRANFIYPLIAAPIKIGFDRVRARDAQWLFVNRRIAFAREHLLDSFFAFLRELGIREPRVHWNLPIGPAEHEWADAALAPARGPILAVHPCASKAERDWPIERFVETIRAAQARWSVHVVLTGGPDRREQAAGARIAESVGANVTNLIGRTTPKQLAAVLARARCLLAPDTGAVHIAVAMNVPVVGLYAVAPARLSGPYGCADLVVDRYDDAVRTILRKDPRTVSWTTRVHEGEPMRLIEAADVLAKLAQVLDGAERRARP